MNNKRRSCRGETDSGRTGLDLGTGLGGIAAKSGECLYGLYAVTWRTSITSSFTLTTCYNSSKDIPTPTAKIHSDPPVALDRRTLRKQGFFVLSGSALSSTPCESSETRESRCGPHALAASCAPTWPTHTHCRQCGAGRALSIRHV